MNELFILKCVHPCGRNSIHTSSMSNCSCSFVEEPNIKGKGVIPVYYSVVSSQCILFLREKEKKTTKPAVMGSSS